MANQRGENQKLLTVPVDLDFLAELDRNLPACGYGNRSQFVRDAIIEKLAAAGIQIPKSLAIPPPRTPLAGIQLNEPSSTNIRERVKAAGKTVSYKIRGNRKSGV